MISRGLRYDLDDRLARNRLVLDLAGEQRRLDHAQAHPEADTDQQQAEQERHPPAPAVERVAGDVAEQRDRPGGQFLLVRCTGVPGTRAATVCVPRPQRVYARPGPHADPHPGGADSRSTNAGHAPERRLRRARGHPYHSVGPARPTAHHPAGGPRVTQERRAARPRRAVLLGTVEHPRTRPVWCPLAARGRHGPEPGFGLAFHTIGMTRPGASPTTLGLRLPLRNGAKMATRASSCNCAHGPRGQ